jgi:hypothetical protein
MGPAPSVFPKGAQIAVLSGDPFKDGLYVVRLKMPSGYKIAAHNHPTDEMVTVISGNFHLGMGDKLDEKKGVLLTAGGYAEAPSKMNHYAWGNQSHCRPGSWPRSFRDHICESCRRPEQEIAVGRCSRALTCSDMAVAPMSALGGKAENMCSH